MTYQNATTAINFDLYSSRLNSHFLTLLYLSSKVVVSYLVHGPGQKAGVSTQTLTASLPCISKRVLASREHSMSALTNTTSVHTLVYQRTILRECGMFSQHRQMNLL